MTEIQTTIAAPGYRRDYEFTFPLNNVIEQARILQQQPMHLRFHHVEYIRNILINAFGEYDESDHISPLTIAAGSHRIDSLELYDRTLENLPTSYVLLNAITERFEAIQSGNMNLNEGIGLSHSYQYDLVGRNYGQMRWKKSLTKFLTDNLAVYVDYVTRDAHETVFLDAYHDNICGSCRVGEHCKLFATRNGIIHGDGYALANTINLISAKDFIFAQSPEWIARNANQFPTLFSVAEIVQENGLQIVEGENCNWDTLQGIYVAMSYKFLLSRIMNRFSHLADYSDNINTIPRKKMHPELFAQGHFNFDLEAEISFLKNQGLVLPLN